MGYVYISDGIFMNPDFHEMRDFTSFLTWMRSVCWAQGNGRIPRIPKHVTDEFADPGHADDLLDAEWWIEDGDDYELATHSRSGYRLWDFGPLGYAARPAIRQALRLAVYERDGFACLHCGTTERLSLDHIYPYSLGGRETLDNLQTLCRSCNSRKGAKVLA